MAYEFECRNVVNDCPGKVQGETEDEVMDKAAEHARDAHGMDRLDDETTEKVRAGIAPLPA